MTCRMETVASRCATFESARVEALYVAGVVRRSDRRIDARSWLDWLIGPGGRQRLAVAGFGPPPEGG
jgi:hypothetical protein